MTGLRLPPQLRLGGPACEETERGKANSVSLTALLIDASLVLAMMAASVHGAVTLPTGTRVPIHFGIRSYNNWAPKWVGLTLWPGIAILIAVLVIVARRGAQSDGASAHTVVLPIVLAVLLVTQLGALKAARRRGRPS